VQSADVEVNRAHDRPPLRKLTSRQVRTIFLGHVRSVLERIFPSLRQPIAEPQGLTPYTRPTLKKLTTEQAKLILLGQLSRGDHGASDFMELLFPDPNSRPVARDKQCSGNVLSGTSGFNPQEEGGPIPTPPPQF
jgi:hypothetical protein